MKNLRGLLVLVFAGLTLLGQGFLLLFKALYWDRTFDLVLAVLPVALPWALGTALVGSWILGARLKILGTLGQTIQGGKIPAGSEIEAVFHILGTLPRFFLVSNLLIFVVGPGAEAWVMTLVGLPAPSVGDLLAVVLVGLATGGMGVLQGIAMGDGLLVRFRERLGVTHIPDGVKDLNLSSRILWTTLGTVCLGGILAGVAAVGFYRELAIHMVHMTPDALASPTMTSPEAREGRELVILAQYGALLGLIVVWALFLIFVVVQNFRRQLSRLNAKVEELSSGSADLTLRVPVVFFDEIGVLTTRINTFLAKLRPLVAEVKDDAADLARSSNLVLSEAQKAAQTTKGLANLQGMVQAAVSDQVSAIHDAEAQLVVVSRSTDTVTEQVESQVRLVAAGAEVIGLMAGNIASVGNLTTQADAVGRELADITRKGESSMGKMAGSMAEIDAASQSVTAIVGVIAKIAAQTNLLAMNAAIEAAHAGAYGQGFAVVADEVRKLAEISAKNAREIRVHNQEMDGKIRAGTLMAVEARSAFAEIARKIEDTSGLLRTIVQAMADQRTGADQVVDTTRGLVSATDTIRNLTEIQKAQVSQVAQAMASIIHATRLIEQSVTSQTLEATQLAQSMDQFTAEAGTNAGASDRLQESVKGFRV